MLFFKLTEFSSIAEWKQLKKLSSAFVFSAFSLGCSDKTICSSMKFIILVNSLFIYCINLKMLGHIDVITYLHLLLTLYYLLFIYTTYLGCIMIIMCMWGLLNNKLLLWSFKQKRGNSKNLKCFFFLVNRTQQNELGMCNKEREKCHCQNSLKRMWNFVRLIVCLFSVVSTVIFH